VLEFHNKMWKNSHDEYLSLLSYYFFLWQEVFAYILSKGDNRKIEEQRKYKHKVKQIVKVHDEEKDIQSIRETKAFNQKFQNSTLKICFLSCDLQEKK